MQNSKINHLQLVKPSSKNTANDWVRQQQIQTDTFIGNFEKNVPANYPTYVQNKKAKSTCNQNISSNKSITLIIIISTLLHRSQTWVVVSVDLDGGFLYIADRQSLL